MGNEFIASSEVDALYIPIQPFAGDTPPVVTIPAQLLVGQNLVAGTVLGRRTADGLVTQFVQGANDGTGVAIGILPIDVNATAAQTPCDIYVAGCFNAAWLTWPVGMTALQQQQAFVAGMIVVRPLYWSNT